MEIKIFVNTKPIYLPILINLHQAKHNKIKKNNNNNQKEKKKAKEEKS